MAAALMSVGGEFFRSLLTSFHENVVKYHLKICLSFWNSNVFFRFNVSLSEGDEFSLSVDMFWNQT